MYYGNTYIHIPVAPRALRFYTTAFQKQRQMFFDLKEKCHIFHIRMCMGAYISHWYLEYIFGILLSPKISKNFSRGEMRGLSTVSTSSTSKAQNGPEGGFEGCEIPMDVRPFSGWRTKTQRDFVFFFGGVNYIYRLQHSTLFLSCNRWFSDCEPVWFSQSPWKKLFELSFISLPFSIPNITKTFHGRKESKASWRSLFLK